MASSAKTFRLLAPVGALGLFVNSCLVPIEDLRDKPASSTSTGGTAMGGTAGDGDGDEAGSGGAEALGGSMSIGGEGPSDCGNNEVEEGEDCDNGGEDSEDCNADCTQARCGDGYVNEAAGEVCDTQRATEECWRCEKPVPDCPSGCTCEYESQMDRYYAFCFDESFAFASVEATCQALGYELVSIETALENQILASRAEALGSAIYFAGGRDSETEGEWRWPTGELFSIDTEAQNGLFVNWSLNEPNGGAGENCLEVHAVGAGWNDIECTATRHWICEYEPPR